MLLNCTTFFSPRILDTGPWEFVLKNVATAALTEINLTATK